MLQIKELRTQLGISQESLSEVLDVSQQTISKYENHRRVPDLQMLIRLADFFHVTLDEIAGRTFSFPETELSDESFLESIVDVSDLSQESRKKLADYIDLLRRSEHLAQIEKKGKQGTSPKKTAPLSSFR